MMFKRIQGRHSFAVIFAAFNDIPKLPLKKHHWTYFRGTIKEYWEDISYGNLDVSPEIFWYKMRYSYSDVFRDPSKLNRVGLISEAKRLANENGVDISRFHGFIVVVNGFTDGSASGDGCVIPIMNIWGQDQWKWCKKCNLLARLRPFKPHQGPPCKKGGNHDFSASWNYCLAHNISDFPGQQGWRWCLKCGALVFKDKPNANKCPVTGGSHYFSSSDNYTLLHQPQGSVPIYPGQQGWRWCKKCGGLFYEPLNKDNGGCPKDGLDHDSSNSGQYTLESRGPIEFDLSFVTHEMGHNLGYPDSWKSGQPDQAYNDPLDIMSVHATGGMFNLNEPGFSIAGPGMNAPNLYHAGWIPEDRIWTFKGGDHGSYTITLAALNHPEQSGYLMACMIGGGKIYTAELRHPSKWDRGLSQSAVFMHELRTYFLAGHRGWFWCKKCGSLNYAGNSACSAGGSHDPRGSMEYYVYFEDPNAEGFSHNWYYCWKCQGLARSRKACPGGGFHDFRNFGKTSKYMIQISGDGIDGQKKWDSCLKCGGLVYAGNQHDGVCAAGGLHTNTISKGDFTISTSPQSNKLQKGWRWCRKCQSLFYAGGAPCPAGGYHDNSESCEYSIPFSHMVSSGDGWKWCRKCQALTSVDDYYKKGSCPAGGTHDHSESGYYRVAWGAVTQEDWRLCDKCKGLVFGANIGNPCPGGGHHDFSGSTNYKLSHSDLDIVYSCSSGLKTGEIYSPPVGPYIKVLSFENGGLQAKLKISNLLGGY